MSNVSVYRVARSPMLILSRRAVGSAAVLVPLWHRARISAEEQVSPTLCGLLCVNLLPVRKAVKPVPLAFCAGNGHRATVSAARSCAGHV
jgi:hypothetical protein